MMDILKITKNDLKKNKETDQWECAEDINFDGHVEIDGDLGWIKFAAGISAKGHRWPFRPLHGV